MTWFRVDTGMPRHLKVKRLARRLGVPVAHATGLLVTLWAWAKDARPDGDLSGLDADDLADVLGWDGDPDVLVDNLCTTGFMSTSMVLHDWLDYQRVGPASERLSNSGRYGAHVRYHVNKGLVDTNCGYCQGKTAWSESYSPYLAPSKPLSSPHDDPQLGANRGASKPLSSPHDDPQLGANRGAIATYTDTSTSTSTYVVTPPIVPPYPTGPTDGPVRTPADADVPEKEPALAVDDGQPDQPVLPVDPALTDPAPDVDGKPVSGRTKADRSLYTPEFEAWWRSYPHRDGVKVGKAPAAKAWAKLAKKDHALVMQATRNLAASGRMAKDPHRFLAPHLRSEAPWREFLLIPLVSGSKGRDRASQLQNEAFRDDPTHYTTRPVNLDDDFD